ncbi:MAG: hypothetical protein KC442_10600 [Thermomicrobiales bacterium]|nr:hypothetical protein [Thermomicrobiales bacterium]
MAHWERSGGAEGIPPISEALDEDLMAMRLGKELGLSAVAVMDLPAHWLGSAMIALEWQRLESETASKRRRGGKPTASPRGKR